MIQLFAKKSCSACIRIPSSFNLRVAKTARASRGIVALRCCRPPDEALASPEQICNIFVRRRSDWLLAKGAKREHRANNGGCRGPLSKENLKRSDFHPC
jgi:hypothetical protein